MPSLSLSHRDTIGIELRGPRNTLGGSKWKRRERRGQSGRARAFASRGKGGESSRGRSEIIASLTCYFASFSSTLIDSFVKTSVSLRRRSGVSTRLLIIYRNHSRQGLHQPLRLLCPNYSHHRHLGIERRSLRVHGPGLAISCSYPNTTTSSGLEDTRPHTCLSSSSYHSQNVALADVSKAAPLEAHQARRPLFTVTIAGCVWSISTI